MSSAPLLGPLAKVMRIAHREIVRVMVTVHELARATGTPEGGAALAMATGLRQNVRVARGRVIVRSAVMVTAVEAAGLALSRQRDNGETARPAHRRKPSIAAHRSRTLPRPGAALSSAAHPTACRPRRRRDRKAGWIAANPVALFPRPITWMAEPGWTE